ncbi:hypothetical protein B296_00049132 [Ensete ventricosum]|uniref:Uncharacterized protein n=1 Tax=Ensete ventricosum TaxID=4639 RepID=A0A426WZP7_ENSVE|nr:hypothetical protein B296_00049132 [Ensete ventricosum]
MAYHVVVPFHHAAVLAVRRASAGKGCRSYLCQVGCTTTDAPILVSNRLPVSGRPRRRAHCPRGRGRGDQVNIYHIILSPRKTFSRCPIRVLKMRSYAHLLACGSVGLIPTGLRNLIGAGANPTEQELGNLNGAGADLTEQKLGNLNGAGADPIEQELGNLNGAGADPTEKELENLNGAGADPTEQELGNLNSAGADPTEQELGNLNSTGADPTEQELGNLNGAEADPTEQELGNLNLGFCREGELGHESWGFG